jgi:hypothetical protein
MLARFALSLTLAVGGCSTSPSAAVAGPASASHPSSVSSSPPPPAPEPHPPPIDAASALLAIEQPDATPPRPSPSGVPAPGSCDELLARFNATLAGAKGACARDVDCACHPVLPIDGTTGVTDRATAKALEALSATYHQRKCPTACATGPGRTCAATCVAGRCR